MHKLLLASPITTTCPYTHTSRRELSDDRKARSAGLEPLDSPEVVLDRVGFPRKQQYQKVESLSGGEHRRLHLASVLIERPNLLILDGVCGSCCRPPASECCGCCSSVAA
jgi:ABC-type glutathione transport system ATPase component